MTTPLLELRRVTVVYDRRAVLENFSMSADRGEFVLMQIGRASCRERV